MSNATASTSNGSHGQQRKTLAVQLDRLDGIIDPLDEALPAAVADAVKEAVSAAVQQTVEAVLREVLTRPELFRAVNPQPVQPVRRPSLLRRAWSWLCGKATGAGDWLCQKAKEVATGACSLVAGVCASVKPVVLLGAVAVTSMVGW